MAEVSLESKNTPIIHLTREAFRLNPRLLMILGLASLASSVLFSRQTNAPKPITDQPTLSLAGQVSAVTEDISIYAQASAEELALYIRLRVLSAKVLRFYQELFPTADLLAIDPERMRQIIAMITEYSYPENEDFWVAVAAMLLDPEKAMASLQATQITNPRHFFPATGEDASFQGKQYATQILLHSAYTGMYAGEEVDPLEFLYLVWNLTDTGSPIVYGIPYKYIAEASTFISTEKTIRLPTRPQIFSDYPANYDALG